MNQNPFTRFPKIIIIFSVILSIITTPIFIHKAQAGSIHQGIIIKAKKIEGDIVIPSVAFDKTSHLSNQIMLRLNIKHATMYNMTISKQISTSTKPIYVHMSTSKAIAENLQVDVTSFSFQGACLNLNQSNKMIVLKNVTLIVHQSKADSMTLKQAKINVNSKIVPANASPTHLKSFTKGLSLICVGNDTQSTAQQLLPINPHDQSQINNSVTSPIKKTVNNIHNILTPLNPANKLSLSKNLSATSSSLEKDSKKLIDQQTKVTDGLIQQTQIILENVTTLKNAMQIFNPLLSNMNTSDYLSKLNIYKNQLKNIKVKETQVKTASNTLSDQSKKIATRPLRKSLNKLNFLLKRSQDQIQEILQFH